MVEVKFCGLTRSEDAELARALGAAYVGVIFAGGPRLQTPDSARQVLGARVNRTSPRRVGVFGAQSVADVLAIAAAAELDVLQLHQHGDATAVSALRAGFGGAIWRVVRVRTGQGVAALSAELTDACEGVDAVVVDAFVDGQLGGTGRTVDWPTLARAWDVAKRPAPLVLAGGLSPANVAEAVRVVEPDVVDVSSGVESAPGIKDANAMRAFFHAAREMAG